MQLIDDERLFARWRGMRDRSAREEIVRRHLPRAHAFARRFARSKEPVEDLEQVAGMGLLKAVDRYEPAAGAAFWSFATPTVVGELKRYMRDSCWTVRVSRPLQEASLAVQGTVADLTPKLGRSPSPSEIAEALGWSREEVIEALEAGSAFSPDSLDAPLWADDEPGASVGDAIATEERGFSQAEKHVALSRAMTGLDGRDVLILHLRFAEDLTQTEIADRVGISQMHVSRLIRRALETIRGALDEDLAQERALVA